MTSGGAGESRAYLDLDQMLRQEIEAIKAAKDGLEPPLATAADDDAAETADQDAGTQAWKEERESRFRAVVEELHREEFTSLCFSGGGIRSATFNLGVLQQLARCGMLPEIDYVSTVSGGGYIGSWLSSWIHREVCGEKERLGGVLTPTQEKRAVLAGKEAVFAALAQQEPALRCKEPYQVRFLRDYSNYLTPRVGILSIDTWAIVGIYVRNLLLNWLVLLPLFFALLLLPRWLTALLMTENAFPGSAPVFLGFGALFGVIAIAYAAVDLPSVGNQRYAKGRFALFFLLPVVLMAGGLSAYFAETYGMLPDRFPSLKGFICFATEVHVAGWLTGLLWLQMRTGGQESIAARRLCWFGVCAAVTGVVAGLLGWLAVTQLATPLLYGTANPELLYLILCVPVILLVFLLTGALLVAALSRFTGEPDREWWGRAGGMVLLAALFWSIALTVVFYGPWLLVANAFPFWNWAWTAVGGASGIAAALMGKAASTPALRPGATMSNLRTRLPALLAGTFIVFVAIALSLLATQWLPVLPQWPAGAPFHLRPLDPFAYHGFVLLHAPLGTVAVLTAVSFALSMAMAAWVNINTFSLHAMYRNRLVRCYLGASRPEKKRDPNPFTGLDPFDDVYLKDLPRRPLQVVNAAWNLVKGRRLAWQQRKATSFVFTPLAAGGNVELPLKLDDRPVPKQPGGFRPADLFGGGKTAPLDPIKLGTAMAISGAAASPNMGYHSSPLVTFIMAFFDVRLGWWVGNPGKGMRTSWRKESPKLALWHLLKETFGLTTDDSPFIYLSDGGHFENLGLYEMVRRRCRYLIVCDAGCDCEATFEDLGNAVRKVRSDFGIEIDIDFSAIRAKKAHFAVGTVKYRDCDACEDAADGLLLYVKPVLTGDEPVDDFNYWKTHPGFPHETTADQWFDEAQFESYRRLGMHSLEKLAEHRITSVDSFFAKAQRLHRAAVKKALQEGQETEGG
ncbi:patatin-like phospholipase family protein [Geomesophilobacter sediminis]|uniref:Patatin-like phospholipase family protein n=1 Tax=Geomesophilobacter sediminis TaxID=2798584 RepID=A0A8J7M303_9BACT|nr:patatin-like phospholipase family protein [Geomesophilobacter sediminis]MBJ6727692.1 patatin-like phospholipase family protein [Geomesophilobacter sediminis]